jgi:hypothetical protein
MGMFDEYLGLPQGTLDTAAREFIPGYDVLAGYGDQVLGLGYPQQSQPPSTYGGYGSGGPTQVQGAGASVGYGDQAGWLGASPMDYSMPTSLALSGPRRIYPYTGGVIPSGYRVAMRPARRPTSGYPGGTYLVPRRRMNPLNPRALMRAERRMGAFTHWVKRHFRLASHMPHRKKRSSFRRKKR